MILLQLVNALPVAKYSVLLEGWCADFKFFGIKDERALIKNLAVSVGW